MQSKDGERQADTLFCGTPWQVWSVQMEYKLRGH